MRTYIVAYEDNNTIAFPVCQDKSWRLSKSDLYSLFFLQAWGKLSDYFAGCVLMPRGWVKGKWAEVNDLKQTAEIFQVTEVSMWMRLKTMGLV